VGKNFHGLAAHERCATLSREGPVAVSVITDLTVVLAGLLVVGIGLLIVMRRDWFRRLMTPSPRRRSHPRRRRRPKFRRAA
jgi:hypothetical protein